MTQLTVRAQHYRLLCGRFELNIQDVESALFEFGVSMRELQRAYPDAESAALEGLPISFLSLSSSLLFSFFFFCGPFISAVMPTPPIAEPFDERTLEALAALPVGQPVPTPSVIPAHLPPYTRAHTFRRSKVLCGRRTLSTTLTEALLRPFHGCGRRPRHCRLSVASNAARP